MSGLENWYFFFYKKTKGRETIESAKLAACIYFLLTEHQATRVATMKGTKGETSRQGLKEKLEKDHSRGNCDETIKEGIIFNLSGTIRCTMILHRQFDKLLIFSLIMNQNCDKPPNSLES